MGLCLVFRLFSSVALVHLSKLHVFSGCLLDVCRKLSDLSAFLLVGRRHFHRKQMPQSVHRDVHLAAFAALVTIIELRMSAQRLAMPCLLPRVSKNPTISILRCTTASMPTALRP